MKILVISHMYPSLLNPTYGVFIHQQVKALQSQGCEVRVVSAVPFAPWPLTRMKKKWRDYAAIPDHDIIEGVEVFYPRYLEFPRSFLMEHAGYWMFRGMSKRVRKIYQEFKFDLIHAHVAIPDGHAAYLLQQQYVQLKQYAQSDQYTQSEQYTPPAANTPTPDAVSSSDSVAASASVNYKSIPLLITIHGQDFQSTIHKGKRCYGRLFQILNQADKVITVSTKLKNIVKGQACFDKIIVVNNGVDIGEELMERGEVIQDGCRKEVKLDQNANEYVRYLISVSNLKKTKGIDLNLKALSILIKKYPNLTYTIIGDGEERQNLEKLADQLNLRDHVRFLGKLPHSEAIDQMATADIFSLPSWQEGFGVVYIEAMAQGIPVIGVQGEGIEDVIHSEQNGLLVKPKDIHSLCEALEKLLGDDAYAKRIGEAGQRTVRESCTWTHNAQKTIEVYQQLLTAPSSDR